ncbi:hypothetical protein JQX09_24510 [Sulfitobacter pseudonitzschiae]|uniref:Uncharacterized protein n=1 Tax=Pseudosulfitobacter pseudonitzschiae TaxID=1402135 RepID=A0A9Q2NVE4_9RHOB|nr:hypothetical protein [Pseudosulfitobacter pseudonitzschiae]MBM2295085.1 hypothetical protein [Pseudosulfitobacter pseudonitzschiae]MBM2300015.1 hypothetical protein [Pseudosulfitobacter pseudonitzschiae]MBM2304923.1 hypothetical protein [Pseudosulfitobacter pseudonitzschiae]MBM2314696.1 hypothetical protein [Pseudosulfitobacter pseudonitzschiae]MBM2319604.1 hypothetical protein [Pseudosulfitobacter pseudonitzschiae]
MDQIAITQKIGHSLCRRNATIIASSASVRTVERGSLAPVFKSSTVARFRHFATVFGLIASFAQLRERSLRSLYCSSDGVRGRGAPVTNLSHNASFQACEKITPSNRGIKHLALLMPRGLMKRATHSSRILIFG